MMMQDQSCRIGQNMLHFGTGLCEETEKVEAVLREAEPPSAHEARVAALEESQSTAEGRIQQLNNEKR